MPFVVVIPAVLLAHAHHLGALAVGVTRAVATLGCVLDDLSEQADDRVRLREVDLNKAEDAVLKAERQLDGLEDAEKKARRALEEAKAALAQARAATTGGSSSGGGGGGGGANVGAASDVVRRAEAALAEAVRAVREAAEDLERKRSTRDTAQELRDAARALRGRVQAQESARGDAAGWALEFVDSAADAADLLTDLLELCNLYLGGALDMDGGQGALSALRAVGFLAQFAGIAGLPGLGAIAGGVAGVGAAVELLDGLSRGLGADAERLERGWTDIVGQEYRGGRLASMTRLLFSLAIVAADIGGAVGPIAQELAEQVDLWPD